MTEGHGTPGPTTPRFGFIGGPRIGHGLDAWAAHCERLGASLLGTGEGASLFEDTYLWLAEAGRVTERVLLGPVLSVPGIRNPLVHANTLATLQRITGGRAFLGIGTGDFGRLDLGLPPATRAELIEYASTVRTLTSGEPAEVAGHSLQLQWTAGTVSVYLGADGPKSLHAAGTMADGVIVGQGGHPDIVRFVRHHVDGGAQATGRALDAIDVWFTSRIYVCDRPNGAIYVDGLDEYGARQCRYFWRTSGSPSEHEVVQRLRERKGIELDEDIARRFVAFNRAFDHENAWSGSKANVELLDRFELREWAGEMFYLSGPLDDVVARVRQLWDAGARNFLVPAITEDRFEAAAHTAQFFERLVG
jgi:alkanesulfonate monooxygenase SsuD/methylene tetrahydromethanopterin reductase-like flavin-dependent oxidoreductase (luciferase family)